MKIKKRISENLFSLAKTSLADLIIGIAFAKFSKLLPVKKLIETNKVVSFWHPKPFWQKHILIVPKKPIKKLTSLEKKDMVYVNEIFAIAKQLVKDLGWEKDGYTLLINGGNRQQVNQLHFHLYSGRSIKS